MNRVIDINISGFRLVKHGNAAGAQGEANVTDLRLTFDETWDGYAKKVTFWDAYGKNPVERTLTTDLLENAASDTRVYLCPIPAEPLAIPGECVFVIDGYADGKRPRSLEGTLKVWPSRMTDNAGQPVDPTPTQAEQLQVQIDTIMEDIGRAAQASDAKEAAEAAAQRAEQAAADVNTGVAAAAEKAEEAAASAQAAKASETTAAANAQAAAQSAAAAAANAASVSTDAAAAKASAEAAARSETNAKASEEAAASAKGAVTASAQEAAQSAQTATQKAQSASQSASAASAAETAAKAAQKAAEQARDEAQGTAGGDFASVPYVDNKAAAALQSANKYTDQKIAAIPTPDVSGQINAHNTDTTAHGDIRQAAADAQAAAANAQAAAGNAQAAAGGKVSKDGDTMTGTLQLQPEGSAGYGRIYKNANAEGDYGLQMQDVDPDGNFMGLTLSGKLQKLEFKKKKASDAGYTYTKLYDEDNPPSAAEVGALSEDGGTVWGDVTVENLHPKVNAQTGEGHTSTLMKNADAENDYGTILRDTNGEAVAELKLNAAEGSLKVSLGGEEQTVYHTGNLPETEVPDEVVQFVDGSLVTIGGDAVNIVGKFTQGPIIIEATQTVNLAKYGLKVGDQINVICIGGGGGGGGGAWSGENLGASGGAAGADGASFNAINAQGGKAGGGYGAGGGGGSGANGKTSSDEKAHGGGGGGSGYLAAKTVTLTSTSVSATIGKGGAGGGASAAGSNGSATSFGSYLSASGGNGGGNGSTRVPNDGPGVGGTGGKSGGTGGTSGVWSRGGGGGGGGGGWVVTSATDCIATNGGDGGSSSSSVIGAAGTGGTPEGNPVGNGAIIFWY